MPSFLKGLITVASAAIIIFVGFNVHWAMGIGAVALVLLYVYFINRSSLYVMKGNAAYANGDLQGALTLMEKASRSVSSKPQHAISYAYLLLKNGEPSKAEKVLKGLLPAAKAGEVLMQTKLNLATAYWLQNRREEAVSLLEEIHQEYKNTAVYGNLGYFKILQGDLESALAFNEEAYEYNDSDLTIMDNLGQTYYLLGRLEEAAQIYAKVIAKSPKHAESYYYYALTLQKLGRTEEACEQVGSATEKPLSLVTSITIRDIERLKEQLESK